jgi:ATPsynthase alpha/beta subunit N-term extension
VCRTFVPGAYSVVLSGPGSPTRTQVGDRITGGDIYGLVHENSLLEHRIMLPPNARGTITYLAPHGQYNIDEEIIEVDFQGQKKVRAQLGGDPGLCVCTYMWNCAGSLVAVGSQALRRQ